MIPRELSYVAQIDFAHQQESVWYQKPGGPLDMNALLRGFQQFFRENGEVWLERFDYKEAGPHLLLQAFLQRIVNGGGRVDREYGLGRRRADLRVVWPWPGGEQTAVVEIKIQRGSREKTILEGPAQTGAYMDATGTAEGHLVIFNRNPKATWRSRIFRKSAKHAKQPVWGM